MARFTVRLYSDFGMVPQDKTQILFESDDLVEIKKNIRDYFNSETYFNAVYFIDNKLNKSGYVGRDLTIGMGENLFSLCEEAEPEEDPEPKLGLIEDNYNQTIGDLAALLDLSYEDAKKFYAAGIKELFFSHREAFE